jgi:sulfur-carrier protein
LATIKIPTPLRAYTGGNATITVQGETVGAALHDLIGQYPDLKPHLYADDKLRNFVNVFLGEEDIRFLDGVATLLQPDAQLRIIPSIAGGQPSEVH